MDTSDWISLGGVAVSLGSLGVAAGSLYLSKQQWEKAKQQWENVKDKIGRITDAGRALEVLPAWYTERMMNDNWLFGLLTTDGRVLVINRITAVSDDGEWLDVELETEEDADLENGGADKYVYAYAPDRTKASVKVSSIVAAQELRTS
jgi:hypothetical protein